MEITTFVLGEMPEWSNGPDSKSGVLLAVPGVRIPFSPLNETSKKTKRCKIKFCSAWCFYMLTDSLRH